MEDFTDHESLRMTCIKKEGTETVHTMQVGASDITNYEDEIQKSAPLSTTRELKQENHYESELEDEDISDFNKYYPIIQINEEVCGQGDVLSDVAAKYGQILQGMSNDACFPSRDSMKCPDCSFIASTLHSLRKHSLEIHTTKDAQKIFKCGECSFRTARNFLLKIHVRSHTGERPYQCGVCSFRAVASPDLKNHLRIHTGEKPFKCASCLFRTATQSNLRKHTMIHTGERPYTCPECPFTSITNSNLKKHIRVHTGEKPFKCGECGFSAANTSNLKKHSRFHNSGGGVNNAFKCHKCSFSAARHFHLVNHLKCHSDEDGGGDRRDGTVMQVKS